MAENESSNRGLLIAALVGLNILCLVAIIGASTLLPRPEASEATAQAVPEKASPSTTGTAAEVTTAVAAKTGDEPKPAESAKPMESAKPAESAKEAASAAPSASAAADAAQGATRAVVTAPRGRGVVRYKPDHKSRLVVTLSPGTAVEITDKTTSGKHVWYQVKTVAPAKPFTGWMQGEALKMQ